MPEVHFAAFGGIPRQEMDSIEGITVYCWNQQTIPVACSL